MIYVKNTRLADKVFALHSFLQSNDGPVAMCINPNGHISIFEVSAIQVVNEGLLRDMKQLAEFTKDQK